MDREGNQNESGDLSWGPWDTNLGGEPVQTKAYGRAGRDADLVAYHEVVFSIRLF